MSPTIIISICCAVVILIVVGWLIWRRSKASYQIAMKPDEPSLPSEKQVCLVKADWCGHCKKMIPIFEQLMSEDPDKYIVIDGPSRKDWLRENNIRAFPAIGIIENGSLSEVQYGAKSIDQLKEMYSDSLE